MNQRKSIDVAGITAFDVHVHIEHEGHDTTVEQAPSSILEEAAPSLSTLPWRSITVPARWPALFSRWMKPCPADRLFLTTGWRISPRATPTLRLLSAASTRAVAQRRSPRRAAWWRLARIHGLKFHPPLQQFSPSDRVAYPL